MTFIHEQLRKGKWVAPWLRHQNMARYQWAKDFVEGRHIVEIGCGSGHGARMLADAGAARVDAFDVSSQSIAFAEQTYATPTLCFRAAAGGQLPVEDASFDCVVSFETIEHVDDDRAFLREIVRVLRPKGRLLCSTPNRTVTNPATSIRDKPFNPHHVREYCQAEFRSLLSSFFAAVQLLGQSRFRSGYVARLSRFGSYSPRFAVRVHQMRKVLGMPWENLKKHWPAENPEGSEPEVLVAVCDV